MLKRLILALTFLALQAFQPAVSNSLFSVEAVGDVPLERLEGISKTLSEPADKIVQKYGVQNFPTAKVKVWGNRAEFEEAYGENAENTRGYIDQTEWEVRIYNDNSYSNLGPSALHEFTHLVTLALNPTIANNPRWLWESIAVFESNRPPVPNPSDLKCVAPLVFPTLNELNLHPFNIYRIGFYLAEYILKNWGQEGLNKLISVNGDLEKSIGITRADFEREFLDYMIAEYGFQNGNSTGAGNDC